MRRLHLLCLGACLLAGDAQLTRPGPGDRGDSGPGGAPWDESMARVWPAARRWSAALEDEYGAFVARLGEAVAARRCGTLQACLRDPAANLLHQPADAQIAVEADCADLPYLLRAYFSLRRDLPFGFVAAVAGRGDDVRFMTDAAPRESRAWREYLTPRELLRGLRGAVHSGMLRLAPEVEGGDFYPVAIRRGAVRPGAVFYDPHGHVLVVVQVRADGLVSFIDAHPDGSLTYRRFGDAFIPGTRALGGGFKRFRPLSLQDGALQRAPASSLPDFDGASQWDPAAWRVEGERVSYQAWVRAQLGEPGVHVDPVAEVREQVAALCRGVSERIDAVALSVAQGLPRRQHPPSLPPNIYASFGEWEVYATPGRDARLKASFRELHATVARLRAGGATLPPLRGALLAAAAAPSCRFSYSNSAGRAVPLTLGDVVDRLFALSFDPYHCPELRWGARLGSAELGTCQQAPGALDWYRAEARLRGRIDRTYGAPTPAGDGPPAPPEIDVRPLLE